MDPPCLTRNWTSDPTSTLITSNPSNMPAMMAQCRFD